MNKFWDRVSGIYDLVENIYNHDVYVNTSKTVASFIDREDVVLECACGTGAISNYIAQRCRKLIATDYADGMLKQTRKNLKDFENVSVEKADIMNLKFEDNTFDVAVAGNVIHLLKKPDMALKELERVIKSDGKIIIPTYINKERKSSTIAAKIFELFGADFKQQFNLETYKDFFNRNGYRDVKYIVVEGKMPCCVAVITLNKNNH